MTREPDGERIARLEEQVRGLERRIDALEAKVWWALSTAFAALSAGVWQMVPAFIRSLK